MKGQLSIPPHYCILIILLRMMGKMHNAPTSFVRTQVNLAWESFIPFQQCAISSCRRCRETSKGICGEPYIDTMVVVPQV